MDLQTLETEQFPRDLCGAAGAAILLRAAARPKLPEPPLKAFSTWRRR